MRELTIDSAGNVIPKPYGASRWANPIRRNCTHEDCETQAKILSSGCPDKPKAHNCCALHENA